MKRLALCITVFIASMADLSAQKFQVDTLLFNGDGSKFINLVLMGDGYTASEQNKFVSDADTLAKYFLSIEPMSRYAAYFNVFAIRVVSVESGIKHPNNAPDCSGTSVPVSNPNCYFGSTFDAFNIHRLVVAMNNTAIASVLAANFPSYDQVLIVANSTYYGGSGGQHALSTIDPASKEIAVHEIGHSFANLADEYYAGDNYAAERANMTANTNPATVKWANWMGANGIGIIQHCCGGKSASWYKPHASCKMNLLGSPFCSVCAQTVIETIHGKVNPVVSYTPAGPIANTPGQFATFKLSKVMKPKPNSLRIIWTLDGNIVAENIDSIVLDQNTLADGTHFLNANVIDTTFLLRVNNHVNIHNSLVHWSINKNNVGIKANSNSSKISCSVYPNPTSQTLHISLELERNSPVRIHILSNDGKMIQEVLNHSLQAGMHERSINIEQLARGKYNLVYKVDESLHTEPFIVE